MSTKQKKLTISCLQKAGKEGIKFMDSYRVRLVAVAEMPIFQDSGLKADQMLLIDEWPDQENDTTLVNTRGDTMAQRTMDVDMEDTVSGPLQFSFISLEQLKKNTKCEAEVIPGLLKKGRSIGVDPALLSFTDDSELTTSYFDCNPLSHSEALNVSNVFACQRDKLKSLLDNSLFALPLQIACSSPRLNFNKYAAELPYTCWTRLLGYHSPSVFNLVQLLSLKFHKIATPRFTVHTAYDLLAPFGHASKECYPAKLILEMQWTSKDQERPSTVITQGATGKLTLSPGSGDVRVAGYLGYNTLTRILNLTDALLRKDPSLIRWPEAADSKQVQRNLEKLLRSSKLRGNNPMDSTAFTSASTTLPSSGTDILAQGQGTDFDFTEQLWTVLKDCGSLEEVICCLETVFAAIQEGNLRPDNNSTVARLIRAKQSNDLHLPTLEPLSTMLIFLELGIDRFMAEMNELYRTMQSIPFSDVAAFQDSLQQTSFPCLAGLKGSSFSNVASRALILVPLYQTYVTMAELHNVLASNAYPMKSLLKLVMAKYAATFKAGNLNPTSYVFELKLKVIDLNQEYMKRHIPYKWTKEAVFTPTSGGPPIRTITNFTSQNRLKYLEAVNGTIQQPADSIKEKEGDGSISEVWTSYLGTFTVISYIPTDEHILKAWNN
ncbi:hypothetical protein WR25_14579 [Diploscapter pachys]|uniref:Protein zwilch n=1 Tax=Diploscapter pachys TaxID=2018661 RepID=A0A2A2LQR9_9BILA|nr:hypothetical protein WR25_14579 [Diploscapter pachys]